MSYVLTSLSGNLISAASAGYAPTNGADVSAIASAYSESAASGKLDTTAQVVTSTGSASAMMMGGTSYYASQINGLNISAQKADVADEWMHAGDKLDTTAFNSSEFYSTSNPSGFVDSAYVESAISGKQDTLTFGYDDDKISAINGSALAGGGGASYTSPSGTIIVGADTLEGTDSGVGVTYLTSFQKSGYFNTAYGKSASGSSNYPTVFNLSGSAGTLYMSVSSNGVRYTSIHVDELNGTVVIPSGSWTIAKYNSVPMYWTAENYYSDTANVQLAHKSDITVTSLTRGRIYDYNVSPATTSTSVSAINGEPILAMSATSASQSLYARYNINGTPLTAMITDTPYSEKGTIHVTGLDVEGSDSAFFPAPYESASSVTLTPYEWDSSFSAQHWSKSFNVSTGDKISRIDFSAGNNYGLVTVEMSFYPDKRAATSFSVAPYQTGVYEFKVPFYAEYVNITASSNYSDSAISSVTLTAYSQDAGTVVPLAHASALPTYGYDGTAITAIDGSAIGGGGGVDSATVSAIASSYAESAASGKLDTTAFNSGDFYSTSNPSGFITVVDLSDYATTAYVDSSVSGKQDASAMSDYATTAYVDSSVSSKLDTTAYNSGDFYSTSNPSGFIDSAYVDSAVSGKADSSALSSYALSADVSGTVDLVSTQSANWGGSALALSAGPGVSLTLSGNTLVASTDETVLWSDDNGAATFTASEVITNFERIAVYVTDNPLSESIQRVEIPMMGGNLTAPKFSLVSQWDSSWRVLMWWVKLTSSDMKSFSISSAGFAGALTNSSWSNGNEPNYFRFYKVVGINRISGS